MPSSPSQTSPLLDVRKLRITYGGVVAVDDVDLRVEAGRLVGLIGPNGAGKTSLIDALTGYHKPTSGQVIFDGEDITTMRPHVRTRRGLTRTFQSVELFDDLSVRNNVSVASRPVTMGSAVRDLFMPVRTDTRAMVEWALELSGLEDVAARLPTELSHGHRKLVGVARALAGRPQLVLLDEPAAGLDTVESAALGSRLRELPARGVSTLLIDHDMGLVLSICDEIYVLDFGRIIAHGSPAEIRNDGAVITAYLGSSHGETAHA